ncbi:CAP domain-containing protein [Leptothrix sp. BB-4]
MTLTPAPSPSRDGPPCPCLIRPNRRVGRNSSARWAAGLSLGLSVLLAACGGGGGGGNGGDPASDPGTAAQAFVGEAVQPVGEANCGQAAMVSEIETRLSLLRSHARSCGSRGSFAAASAVTWNAVLYEAARAHTLEMADHAYFDHVGLDGSSPAARVTAAGYAYSTTAENIARGRTSASGRTALDVAAVLDLWTASDDHCANLMAPRMREIGLACVANRFGVRYWTLVLAAPLR